MDVAHLVGIELFSGLSKRELAEVARLADEVDVAAGRHLLDQGALPHEFFVMLEGEAEVRRDAEVVATLRAGDFFGEIAILQNDRRTATVIASTPCRLAVMTPRGFETMKHDMPAVAATITAAAVARMSR